MTSKRVSVDVINRAMGKVKQKLDAAKIDIDHKLYEDAVSRCYYAVFHAVSAVLSIQGMSFSSHNQTIGAFNKHFVKENIFPSSTTKTIKRLMENRQIGDYSWSKSIDKESAVQDYQDANEIVKLCQEYLSQNLRDE